MTDNYKEFTADISSMLAKFRNEMPDVMQGSLMYAAEAIKAFEEFSNSSQK